MTNEGDNLDKRLTVIVTTSVVRSNPDISVISAVLTSLRRLITHYKADLVVVYDGYIPKASETKFKSARCSKEEAERYHQFISASKLWITKWHQNLFKSALNNNIGSVHDENNFSCTNIQSLLRESYTKQSYNWTATIEKELYDGVPSLTFLQFSTRFGFAHAVREAIYHVRTPFVLVNQHDWTFDVSELNINSIIETIQQNPDLIRYITFPSVATKSFLTTCWINRALPPVHCTSDPSLKATRVCQECHLSLNSIPNSPTNNFVNTSEEKKYTSATNSFVDSHGHIFKFNSLSFLRCHFWYDKPHITRTQIYKDIFSTNILKRGDFIEDVYGQLITKQIKMDGLRAHEEYGVWLFWDDDRIYLRHLNGRGFLTEEMRKEVNNRVIPTRKERNRVKFFGEEVDNHICLPGNNNSDTSEDEFNLFE